MHPVLFQIGGFVVGTYGIMIVIGLLTGLWLMSRLARRRGLPPEFFFDLTFALLVAGMIGARLFYIFTEWDAFIRHPMDLLLSRQGFVFLGGFVLALIVGIIFTLRRHMPLFDSCDVVAPGLVLAHGFGRIGCFLAGCCYGMPVDPAKSSALVRALAVQFPVITGKAGEMFNFAYQGQMAQGLIAPGTTAPLPVLPTELFEMAGNFTICLILLWFWKRRKFSGEIFALYLIFYSILRFAIEFVRGDVERGVYRLTSGWQISNSQIICIVTLVIGLAIWGLRRRSGFEPAPVVEPNEAAASTT